MAKLTTAEFIDAIKELSVLELNFGFLLDPQTIGTILGLESYEMYKVNVLAGWVSPKPWIPDPVFSLFHRGHLSFLSISFPYG